MSSIDRLTGSSRFCEMYFPHLLYLQAEGINPVIPLMSKNHLSRNHPPEISSNMTPYFQFYPLYEKTTHLEITFKKKLQQDVRFSGIQG